MSSEIEIVDISLVDYNPPRYGGCKYPWANTEVGQSFFVQYDDGAPDLPSMIRRLRNSLNWNKRKVYVRKTVQFRFKPHKRGKKEGVLAGRVK